MECNFLEKSPEEFVELFYSGLLSAIGCQADYDDTRSNSDERARQRQKYPHNTQIFSIDWIKKTCWKKL
jgi:hypothetical protein